VLRRVLIRNYRVFENFKLDFVPGVNILVGDNGEGKSTLLEAINLALTARLHGSLIFGELSPHLFTQATTKRYVRDLRAGRKPAPPEIVIELYFAADDDHTWLRGTNNLLGEDCPGVRLKIKLDEDLTDAYQAYVADPAKVLLVPTEYYMSEWLAFSGNAIRNARNVPDASLIDATAIRLQNGADHYMQQIIGQHLEPGERVELSRLYRSLRETFAGFDEIGDINTKLADSHDEISSRRLSLSIDTSHRASWERALVPHLDDIPFQLVGSGEQSSLKIMLALNRRAEDSHVILVEEPENHLSFSSLNILMEKIAKRCAGKQVLVTTHSSYVLNKLGLGNLMLLTSDGAVDLTQMPASTVNYFKKLPGYDTLRVVLAKRVILVEGPSDELVVQRAYHDVHGKFPIEDGVDVISVRGLQAKRFLDIAVPLKKTAVVVNDNDDDPAAIRAKYAEYEQHSFISVHIGKGDARTLEPQLVAANGLDVMNKVLSKKYKTEAELLTHMKGNKTECALKVFESDETITMPEYILDAVA
jgi:putative ATP-dependent endonuclease of the OLD family